MDYSKAQEFINRTAELGSRLGLDSIRELLRRLGNPQDSLKVIHVAGTNGKGSTCAFLEFGLRECGFRTGRYISPVLFEYLERYQINGKLMTEDEFALLAEKVQKLCKAMEEEGFLHPTVFEVETAIAFLYFQEQKVDAVILETGMGGKEDATNVVKEPLATVFASISFDHMAYLGDTIEDIARCKAGIMRKGVPAICGHMPPVMSKGVKTSAFVTLMEEAEKISAPLHDADKFEIPWKINNPLAGSFQWDNLKLAILTAEVLKDKLIFDMDTFISGVEKTKWPGRYETISEKPLIIRDGAHNEDAVKRLVEALEADERIKGKVHFVMGVYADKAYETEIEIIKPLAKSFTAVTPPTRSRALDGKVLAGTAERILKDIPVKYADTMSDAIEQTGLAEEETIVVFGSLSLAILTEETAKNKG